jgi:SAM-dependent methyltransferase
MIIFLFFILFLIFLVLILSLFGYNFAAIILGILILIFLSITLILTIRECFRVFKGNAPFLSSNKKLIKRIIDEIDFKDGSVVYELGCGQATFLRELKKKKNVIAIGFEYFLVPYLIAKILNIFSGQKIRIYYRDFFKANLGDADYIFCFLICDEMTRLEKKLQDELKKGALVISNTFSFKNWELQKVIIVDSNKKNSLNNKIYIYQK